MFKFGDGRMGEVCHAADITVGVAGFKGAFTAFVLDSDIPALLSKGALESLRGRHAGCHGEGDSPANE